MAAADTEESKRPALAGAISISAQTGEGFDALLEKIDLTLGVDPVVECTFRIPAGEGNALHLVHQLSQVRSTRYDEEVCEIRALASASLRKRLAAYLTTSLRV